MTPHYGAVHAEGGRHPGPGRGPAVAGRPGVWGGAQWGQQSAAIHHGSNVILMYGARSGRPLHPACADTRGWQSVSPQHKATNLITAGTTKSNYQTQNITCRSRLYAWQDDKPIDGSSAAF